MPIDLNMSVNATATGQAISSAVNLQAGAIEWISLDILSGATDQQVMVQPGPASAMILLALQADPGDTSISYKSTPAAAPIVLNGAHIYNGPHMIALLGPNPTSLYFSSTNPSPINIRILVGRNP